MIFKGSSKHSLRGFQTECALRYSNSYYLTYAYDYFTLAKNNTHKQIALSCAEQDAVPL